MTELSHDGRNYKSIGVEEESLDDLEIHQVGMSACISLNIPSVDTKTHLIQTVARIGCDAILVWRVIPNCIDQVLLTHYPPDEVEQHLQVLREFAPYGNGVTRAVYLTARSENRDDTIKFKREVQRILGRELIAVHLTLDKFPFSTPEEMQRDNTLFQLCATKGYNGNPNSRRIIIPTRKGQVIENAYVAEF